MTCGSLFMGGGCGPGRQLRTSYGDNHSYSQRGNSAHVEVGEGVHYGATASATAIAFASAPRGRAGRRPPAQRLARRANSERSHAGAGRWQRRRKGFECETISFACTATPLGPRADSVTMNPLATLYLNQLPDGARATVARVVSASADIDAVALRRLGELGFLPGEPVQLLRRGPGGREPLAVLIGETMFALRLLEAQCIESQARPRIDEGGRPGPRAERRPTRRRAGAWRWSATRTAARPPSSTCSPARARRSPTTPA